MKKVLALVLALMLFVPAFAFAEDVVKVGVFEPVTGENGGGGFQEVLGMRYANQVVPTVTSAARPTRWNWSKSTTSPTRPKPSPRPRA
jgi:branched-chain amino acid transport system substrate-binding protein